MKKVLILAYDFPPYVSVGALRPYSWYKYFHESDVYPIIVTRQWNIKYQNSLDYLTASEFETIIAEKTVFGEIVKTPFEPNLAFKLLLKFGENRFKLLRKTITAFYVFAQWIILVGPKVQLYFGARKYLKENPVDFIIATGEPFVLFKYASKLSREFNIPWIADYRDPWTQDKERNRRGLPKILSAYFEKKYVSNAVFISTVNSFFKRQISQLLPQKTFYILPNGFDPEAISGVNNTPQNNQLLTISFAGTIYKWHPYEAFFEVCNDLIQNSGIKFKIDFYGINIDEEINNLIQHKFPVLFEYLTIHPKMANMDLIKYLANGNVLLLFNDYSIIGTKIFDYLALNQKIILCFSNDKDAFDLKGKFFRINEFENESKSPQADLIAETNSGIVVKDKEHLKQVLHDLYNEFTEKGFIACNSTGVEKYSRKIQTQKLAEIIHSLIDEKPPKYS
jgi:hypothetical protein